MKTLKALQLQSLNVAAVVRLIAVCSNVHCAVVQILHKNLAGVACREKIKKL